MYTLLKSNKKLVISIIILQNYLIYINYIIYNIYYGFFIVFILPKRVRILRLSMLEFLILLKNYVRFFELGY